MSLSQGFVSRSKDVGEDAGSDCSPSQSSERSSAVGGLRAFGWRSFTLFLHEVPHNLLHGVSPGNQKNATGVPNSEKHPHEANKSLNLENKNNSLAEVRLPSSARGKPRNARLAAAREGAGMRGSCARN